MEWSGRRREGKRRWRRSRDQHHQASKPARPPRPPATAPILLLLGTVILVLTTLPRTEAQLVQLAPTGGDPAADVPAQRRALQQLLAAAGNGTLLLTRNANAPGSNNPQLPGELPWDTPKTSYCDWWGVSCCGATLTAVNRLCRAGPHSVSSLELSNLRLDGTLPESLGDLEDLHVLDLSFNMG
jgi:hypothetical protein